MQPSTSSQENHSPSDNKKHTNNVIPDTGDVRFANNTEPELEGISAADQEKKPVKNPEEENKQEEKIPKIVLPTRKQQVEKFAELPFHDNMYPKQTFSHAPRKFLRLEITGKEDSIGNFESEADTNCVICLNSEDADGNAELISCHGIMSGETRNQERLTVLETLEFKKQRDLAKKTAPKKKPLGTEACRSKFHSSCAMKYNAGSFLYQYAARLECQAQLLCPLHCCTRCNLDHHRQSAYLPDLIECAKCLRAFHISSCYPAGAVDHYVTYDEKRFELLICPDHEEDGSEQDLDKIQILKSKKGTTKKIRAHIRACLNPNCCAPKNAKLLGCDTCVRSFHRECLETVTINGDPIPTNQCEPCICSDEIPLDRPVIALFGTMKGFWLGMTRSWYRYPTKARGDPKFEKLGFTVIEWIIADGPTVWSIEPLQNIAPLISAYIPLAEKDLRELWTETLGRFEDNPFEKFPAVNKLVYQQIKTSRHLVPPPKAPIIDGKEVFTCTCKGENRCTPGSGCENLELNMECPKSCEENKKPCPNRKVSNGFVNPNIELRISGKKGFGVFATKDLAKGEFLAEYAGEIIDRKEKSRRMAVITLSRDFQANHYMMDADGGKTIDAARYGNISRYFNHSCEPNAKAAKVRIPIDNKGNYEDRNYLVVEKEIEEDDEITFFYNMEQSENLPECICGAKNCLTSLGISKKKEEDSTGQGQVQKKKKKAEKKDVESALQSEKLPVQKGAKRGFATFKKPLALRNRDLVVYTSKMSSTQQVILPPMTPEGVVDHQAPCSMNVDEMDVQHDTKASPEKPCTSASAVCQSTTSTKRSGKFSTPAIVKRSSQSNPSSGGKENLTSPWRMIAQRHDAEPSTTIQMSTKVPIPTVPAPSSQISSPTTSDALDAPFTANDAVDTPPQTAEQSHERDVLSPIFKSSENEERNDGLRRTCRPRKPKKQFQN